MNRVNTLAALAIAALLLVGIAYAAGSSMLVSQTTTETNPCTGTGTLQDGSPNGIASTFTDECTNTFTYNSTLTFSTSSTSTNTNSTGGDTEMVAHVFGPGCSILTGVATSILRFDSDPIASNGDKWQYEFVVSDVPQNLTVLTAITTDGINGTHNFILKEYNGTNLIQNDTAPIPSIIIGGNDDFSQQEFVDFYSDGGGMQMFWYGPHASSIVAFVDKGLRASLDNITDVSAFFAPLVQGQPVEFSAQDLPYFQVGQQFGDMGPNVTSDFNASPCATPLGLSFTQGIQSNACELLIPDMPPTTSFDLNMTFEGDQ